MVKFEYTIKDVLGIHARPAGLLAKEAKKYSSKILIGVGDKNVEATKLMAIMTLGIKCGQTLEITVEGDDEATAAKEIKEFFKNNL